LKIFKFTAEGDAVYVEAKTFQDASDRFESFFGIIPEELLKWEEVKKLPKGEEFL